MTNLERYRNSVLAETSSSISESSSSNSKTSSSTTSEDEKIEITIKGQIENPGKYTFDSSCTLQDVISAAGGLTVTADESALNYSYSPKDGANIYIPATNGGSKISINTANIDTLDMLPSIGQSLASKIIEYRTENGDYVYLEQIMEVQGLKETIFEKIKDYIKL